MIKYNQYNPVDIFLKDLGLKNNLYKITYKFIIFIIKILIIFLIQANFNNLLNIKQ